MISNVLLGSLLLTVQLEQPLVEEAEIKQAAVATAEAHATEVATQIMANGGNAIDAAVAASFALAVTFPAAGNIGGGGFMLYREPSGLVWFLDFREVAPAAAAADMYLDDAGKPTKKLSTHGWKAAGVPGSVFGMYWAHREWGKLSWAELLEPAIKLARDGFPVSAREHRVLGYSAKYLKRDPLARLRLLDDQGNARPEGSILRQPELAATLTAIAEEGQDAFRRGKIIEELLAASDAGGGILAAQDFENYQARIRPVQRIHWNGMDIYAPTAPSSGGVFLEQTLGMLSHFQLGHWGWDDMRGVHVLGEVEARAFSDRNRWLGDPASLDFDPRRLVEPDYIAQMAAKISPNRATLPAQLHAGEWTESEETTHYSVIGPDGGAVSVTTTLNSSYGAKIMAPGGFLMNNEMDDFAANPGQANQFGLVQGEYNAVVPGNRPLSSMCPTIVVKNGEVDAVLGSPGGPTILTTVLQVLLNRYTYGMSPRKAVLAPRFHRQDRPAQISYEAQRLSVSGLSKLRSIGQAVKKRGLLGDVNAVFRSRGGELEAVAEYGLGKTIEM